MPAELAKMFAPPPKIFLSYAQEDASVADAIAGDLRRAGLDVWSDRGVRSPLSFANQIIEAVHASDVLLVLISPSSVRSLWTQKEVSNALLSELSDRAVTVIPALIADCDVPPALRDRQLFDLRAEPATGTSRLVEQLSVLSDIDYSHLGPREFERLVSELLRDIGFEIAAPLRTADGGFDFDARFVYEGPFGLECDRWLVEVKLYRHSRLSVSSVHQLLGALQYHGVAKGLIVTSGQPTSAARESVAYAVERTGVAIRI